VVEKVVGFPTPARSAISSMETSSSDFLRMSWSTTSMICLCDTAADRGGRPRRLGAWPDLGFFVASLKKP
jgi:hypothetical protein